VLGPFCFFKKSDEFGTKSGVLFRHKGLKEGVFPQIPLTILGS
jgi:hypothetical protein